MSISYQFRPISTWPGALRTSRRNAPFKAPYASTLRLLDRELTHLRARKIVIEAAFCERDIRQDGMIRADARAPRHPGIILSFETPNGPLRFPCDTYIRWQDNLRAIALALEALRRVDRYGVTKRGEQYTGWKQLPPTNGAVTPAMTPIQAAQTLCKLAGMDVSEGTCWAVMRSSDTLRAVYRAAALATHPDRTGGLDADFKLLQEAKRVLDAHHGQ